MNKSAIQRFAIQARKDLIDGVSQRAYQYGITKDGYGERDAVTVGGRALTSDEQRQRKELVDQIVSKGYTQVMEEVAYTWFNRFIALRFMEVNNYLPSHIRVFSDSTGAFKPEILNDVLHLDLPGLKLDKVAEYIENNQTEDLYRYLLLTQCNALNEALPQMFERMGGFTELLLPNNILKQDSVLGRMVTEIPEEDWTDQVQIIGWLYQYYNTELKDDTFALLKKNVKITKERIPSATQLFTPDWIVRYMVENSLGRLWIEGHPNTELKAEWKYYLDEAEQEAKVQEQLEAIRAEHSTLKPQDIKVIDPCMGSGHILVYAFDVLVQIYKTNGISERDAARSILENNLYGLDIDDRAAQLAYFAVMMKARQYDRRIFSRGVQPHVYSIVESNGVDGSTIDYFINNDPKLKKDFKILVDELRDAKEYGSILNISQVDFAALYARVEEVRDDISIFREIVLSSVLPLIQVAEVMERKYDVVVTNPPYMVMSNGSPKLDGFVKKHYPDTKADLFACFIQKGNKMLKPYGFNSMVTMQSWMFLSSFEKMRNDLLHTRTITNLMHMDNMVMGIAFGTAVTIFRQNMIPRYKGNYHHIKLHDISNDIPVEFPVRANRFSQVSSDGFSKMPNSPIAYWATDNMVSLFKEKCVGSDFVSGGRNKTHNDEKYLRMLWEVPRSERWTQYAKGGAYRKWYGDIEYLVDWTDTAKSDYASHGGLVNKQFWGKEGITWTIVTAYKASFRFKQAPVIYSSVSPTIFDRTFSLNKYVLALLNSKVSEALLNAMNPTLATNVSDILGIPLRYQRENDIGLLTDQNIRISKTDWDSFETSWDFQIHPLIDMIAKGGSFFDRGRICLSECVSLWETECSERFSQLKANEEELNRIFIDIYGLQDDLTPDVDDKDVTVRKFDLKRDIKSLISYAVGCMFGRYSPDEPGLIYSGGEWDASKYSIIIPDKDNIIPICDDDYFDDDITGRFVKWVATVYGDETLEENLKFIADALGGKGTSREVIRSYFINDFYADHLKIYQKRPIYWLFDSGKKNGFKALIYMHRYQSDLLARMRTDYVHEQQERYRTQLSHLTEAADRASASERVKLNKQIKKIQEQALEIQKYEEKIHHLADQNISIDLDDGVKHNYELFADVLAKIK